MFKKTAKIILAITLTVSSFQFIGTTNAYAKENPKSNSTIEKKQLDYKSYKSIDEAFLLNKGRLPDNFIINPSRQPRDTAGTYTVVTKLSEEIISTNTRLGYHPDFKRFRKADFYYFSTSEIDSFSVSLAIGPISVTYSPASSSSGFGVQADSSRPSRPVIYGDVLKTKYKAELRRRVTDELINTYYNTNLTGINTEIQIEYQ